MVREGSGDPPTVERRFWPVCSCLTECVTVAPAEVAAFAVVAAAVPSEAWPVAAAVAAEIEVEAAVIDEETIERKISGDDLCLCRSGEWVRRRGVPRSFDAFRSWSSARRRSLITSGGGRRRRGLARYRAQSSYLSRWWTRRQRELRRNCAPNCEPNCAPELRRASHHLK